MTSYRICIIGDSHVAALKHGWDELAPHYPHVEMLYFAREKNGLYALVRHGTKITLDGKGARNFLHRMFGYKELNISGVDLFVCVGMMEAAHAFVEMQAGHKLAMQSAAGPQYVSEAAYLATYADMFHASVLGHVVRTLSQAGVEKAFVCLKPRRSEELLDRSTVTARIYKSLISAGCGPHLSQLLENALARVLPSGFRHLPPPNKVLSNELLTKSEFSSGSVKLRSAREHGRIEVKHMNAEYGKRVLIAMLDQLGIESQETPKGELPHDR